MKFNTETNNNKNVVKGELPFCEIEINGNNQVMNYWSPIVTGSNGEDRAIGKYYADLAILYMRDHSHEVGSHMLLSEIIKSMRFDGIRDAVNFGFINRIAEQVS